MSDDGADSGNEKDIRRGLYVIQSMIDISADRLEGLRTQCATSAELTQQEIRSLETKLVKMFTDLLLTKAKLSERLPRGLSATGAELHQWLRVVGLSPDSLNVVLQRVSTLETLLEKSELELRAILHDNANVRDEEVRRFIRAMYNLKQCRQAITCGFPEPNDLFWDSWDRQHQSHRSGTSPRTARSNARLNPQQQARLQTSNSTVQSPVEISPPETAYYGATSPEESSTTVSTFTPSPSPPNSPSVLLNNSKKRGAFPTTPPAKKKHTISFQPGVNSVNVQNVINSNPLPASTAGDQTPLPKSKSHESQLVVTTTTDGGAAQPNSTAATVASKPRSRLHTEPGPGNHTGDMSAENCSPVMNNLTVPRSPLTPVMVNPTMGHDIPHHFTKNFKMMTVTCDLCGKPMFFGLKCKECKYRCHKDCEQSVPPSCGLPQKLFKAINPSPNMNRTAGGVPRRGHQQQHAGLPYHGPDSSSAGSSCNSSSPSSPALLNLPPQTPSSSKNQFSFPEVPQNHHHHHQLHHHQRLNNVGGDGDRTMGTKIIVPTAPLPSSPRPTLSELADTHQSNDSDKTISLSGSTSASTDSDRTPIRLDSTEERDSGHWPRQNSLSLKEWDIPYDDLHLLEKIGKGRFGTVHRALWHGDVAVKLLKEDYLDDERTLEAFKLEVATFKKTRHENVVLFMGACMKPPRLAIVTSLCKGNTLFTHIHLRKDKFNLNKTTLVAQQISQGMGYLHARGIVHKDLKTKNIFLENGKVIITDFGLFSATKLLYCDLGLGIPTGWLCYLAPELIRGLKPFRPTDEDLPFSKASDVFAFGTVWYELLCGEFPFKSQPPEAIIWQVGRGMKQTLANLQASRDVKDILMVCWSFQADDRKDFANLLTLLERLPKKRLARSPSHPVQLSRSAESVF
ncbi:kinase suppressor of Ras 2 [Phlebotomus argentipes]|uniref:kinase suppressor of Ras 2 n=1 Tax=Phlebotomus argentipes TaxID=94469 RepID=UPI002892EB4F|nr:kinase suppressor of Ras 2 [Phlebotomus argentipes]